MSKESKPEKKRFRMPWGKICLGSFLAMILSFFLYPPTFWLAVIAFDLSFAAVICRAGDMPAGGLPWYYGGGLF